MRGEPHRATRERLSCCSSRNLGWVAIVGVMWSFSCESPQPPESCDTIPARQVYVGKTDAVRVCFVDPNGDRLSYVVAVSPSGIVEVERSSDVLTIAGSAPGVATVSVTAIDPGDLKTTIGFVVVVPNRAPTPAKPIPPLEVFMGDSATVDVSDHFHDPDGQSLSLGGSSSDTGVATVLWEGSVATVLGKGKGIALVAVTATDPGGLAATQDLRVTVPNRAPVAVDSIPARIVDVGDTATLEAAVRFRDPDGDSLVFSASSSDTTRVRVSVSLGTVAVAAIRKGVATVRVTATDPEGLSATLDFSVTAPNRPPAPGDTVPVATVPVGESATVDLTGYFNDPDGDTLAYTAAVSDSTLVSASVSGAAVTVVAVAKGEAAVTVTATDPEGLAATQEFTVVVPNRAPAAEGTIPSDTIEVGDSVTLELSPWFIDPDGDSLSYSAVASAADVTRASVTAAAITVVAIAKGETAVTATATDTEGLTAAQEFTVIVPNRAPLAEGAIPPRTLEVGDALELDLSPFFSDPDGDPLAYSAVASDTARVGVRISGAAAHVAAVAKGEVVVTITATDTEGLTAAQAFAVTVPNRPPVAKGTLPTLTVEAGKPATVELSPYFGDPDGDPLVHAAATSDSARVEASVTGSAVTVVAVAKGEASVRLTATDSEGLAATRNLSVLVPNRAPVVEETLPSRTVEAGDSVTLELSACFSDPDGDPLSYTAVAADPAVGAASVTGAALTLTAIGKGQTALTVTARDAEGLATPQVFTVTVPNRAPLAQRAISPRTLEAGDTVELDLAPHFSDPDGDRLVFTAAVSDAAVAGVSVAGTAMTIAAVARGQAAVTVTATDVDGLEATQEFDLTVRNQPPAPVGSIPERVVEVGDTVELDLTAYFRDPDGDPLVFAVSATDTTVVDPSVSGATLEVVAIARGRDTLTITAADGEGLRATQPFTVTVPNRAPYSVGAFPVLRMKGGGFARVDPSPRFADPDGDSLSYEATSSNLNVVRTWVSRGEVLVRAYSGGRATISVTAADPDELKSTQRFQVRVKDSGGSDENRAPVVVDTIAGQSMEEDQARTLKVASHFEDPDGDDLTFTAASSDTSVATAEATGSDVVLRAKAEGSATVKVTARDPGGLTAKLEFAVDVAEPPDTNRAPVAVEEIARQSMEVDRTRTLWVADHFEDPDGDDLTFAAASSDTSVATAEATGSNVVLRAKAEGTATVEVTARDPDGLSAELEFAVNVSEPADTNRAPVVVGTIARQSMEEDQTRTLKVASRFEDPDGDDLTFAAASSNTGVVTAKATGSNVVLSAQAEGAATVEVTARDPDGLSAALEFTVKVTAPPDTNRAPVAVGTIARQNMEEDQTRTLKVASRFEDPDGDDLKFAAASSNTGVVTAKATGSNVVLSAQAEGSATVEVTARDPGGLSAAIEFTVEVSEPPETNRPPVVVDSVSRRVREEGDSAMVNAATLFEDPDGDELTFAARSADTSVSTATVQGAEVTVRAVSPGDAKITITASDTAGSAATLDFAVKVVERGTTAPICDRTPAVRREILALLGDDDCGAVTSSQLAWITELELQNTGITSLKSGDFAGLTRLSRLYLQGNRLTSLPSDVFSGLSSLTRLIMSHSRLTSLPSSVFSGLGQLVELNISHNEIESLPSGLFAGLSSLKWLFIDTNSYTALEPGLFADLSSLYLLFVKDVELSTLPQGVFSGLGSLHYLILARISLTTLRADTFEGMQSLTQLELSGNSLDSLPQGVLTRTPRLEHLWLDGNNLTELPDRVLEGLSSLKTLWLHGNRTDPIPIEVSLIATGSGKVKAVVPTGAPFSIDVSVSVSGGSTDGVITIPVGALESAPWDPGDATSVDIVAFSDLPQSPRLTNNLDETRPAHNGYVLTRSPDLPLSLSDEDQMDFGALALSPYATSIDSSRNTSWIRLSSFTPSAIGRWNALRPEISPIPPARLLITAVRAACAKSLSPLEPPELISPTRPM